MMWTEVADSAAIDKLMNDYGCFHDSCIVSVSYARGSFVDANGAMGDGTADEHTVTMLVHSQWGKGVVLFGCEKMLYNGIQGDVFL